MVDFSIQSIFEWLFAGIASSIAGLVEDTILEAANALIAAILGGFPGLV